MSRKSVALRLSGGPEVTATQWVGFEHSEMMQPVGWCVCGPECHVDLIFDVRQAPAPSQPSINNLSLPYLEADGFLNIGHGLLNTDC